MLLVKDSRGKSHGSEVISLLCVSTLIYGVCRWTNKVAFVGCGHGNHGPGKSVTILVGDVCTPQRVAFFEIELLIPDTTLIQLAYDTGVS